MKKPMKSGVAVVSVLLAACATPTAKPPAEMHLAAKDQAPPAGNIPEPVQKTLAVPKPGPSGKTETYSVVVNNVRVHDLLFALARDAKVNVDIHPGINGNVTLNAIDQTLPQLLDRIGRQLPEGMRWSMDGPNVTIMPDLPVLRTYQVDYVNMNRETSGSMAITSQVASGLPGGGGASSTNSSSTTVKNQGTNKFWETLVANLRDLLRETDKQIPCDPEKAVKRTEPARPATTDNAQIRVTVASAAAGEVTARDTPQCNFREAASVIASPESGVISVRSTMRQHEKVQEFLDKVMTSARRQVMIEATIVEVQLEHRYQQGIDWSRVRAGTGTGITEISQTSAAITGTGAFTLATRAVSGGGNGIFTSTLKLLETFGNVKVLSSPKISVLNNQTAVIKVTNDQIYFTIESDVATGAAGTQPVVTFTTTVHQVPVGFVMNVTPQINDNDTIILNVRPSISRVVGQAIDPNPALRAPSAGGVGPAVDIVNAIPIVRSREMESVMLVENGNIAVLGGLMEDEKNNSDSAVPWFHNIPLIGSLFTQRDDIARKTELVIFLRPVIIREASIEGDYKNFRAQLPVADFFNTDFTPPRYQVAPASVGDRQ